MRTYLGEEINWSCKNKNQESLEKHKTQSTSLNSLRNLNNNIDFFGFSENETEVTVKENLGKKRKYTQEKKDENNNLHCNKYPSLSSIINHNLFHPSQIKNRNLNKLNNSKNNYFYKGKKIKIPENLIDKLLMETLSEEEIYMNNNQRNIFTINNSYNNSNCVINENNQKKNFSNNNCLDNETIINNNSMSFLDLLSKIRESSYNLINNELSKEYNNNNYYNIEILHFKNVKYIQENKKNNEKNIDKIKNRNNNILNIETDFKIGHQKNNYQVNNKIFCEKEKQKIKDIDKIKCIRCNKIGHSIENCQNNWNQLILCNQCYCIGHKEIECLSNPIKIYRAFLLNKLICFICGSNSHAICPFSYRELPEIKNQDKNEIFIENENNKNKEKYYENNLGVFIKDNKKIKNENFKNLLFCSLCAEIHNNEECLYKEKFKNECDELRRIEGLKIIKKRMEIENFINKNLYKNFLNKKIDNKSMISFFQKESIKEEYNDNIIVNNIIPLDEEYSCDTNFKNDSSSNNA